MYLTVTEVYVTPNSLSLPVSLAEIYKLSEAQPRSFEIMNFPMFDEPVERYLFLPNFSMSRIQSTHQIHHGVILRK